MKGEREEIRGEDDVRIKGTIDSIIIKEEDINYK